MYRGSVANCLNIMGDTASFTTVWTDEAKAEVKKLLNSRKYYVGTNGRMQFSASTDMIDYVLGSITGL